MSSWIFIYSYQMHRFSVRGGLNNPTMKWWLHISGICVVRGSKMSHTCVIAFNGYYTERRSVTSNYHGSKFLDHNIRKPKQQRWWYLWEKQQVYIRANLHMHHTFCTSVSHCCMTVTWIFLISGARLIDYEDTRQQFSFSKLRYCPFRFNPGKFCQHLINWIKLN